MGPRVLPRRSEPLRRRWLRVRTLRIAARPLGEGLARSVQHGNAVKEARKDTGVVASEDCPSSPWHVRLFDTQNLMDAPAAPLNLVRSRGSRTRKLIGDMLRTVPCAIFANRDRCKCLNLAADMKWLATDFSHCAEHERRCPAQMHNAFSDNLPRQITIIHNIEESLSPKDPPVRNCG